ncbi:ferritin-like domain-containing protein [Sporosarcina aquimarina]|uniref:ferritin-like domain-containing protein n=1 Tax=Sporosarcina aquimarina TaxID=114975 RepID=UPI0020411E67|nr:ferritin-like domain-containing protein [Sporosarcina aquimarina]MCM3756519.1 ferritin-like domain-containing protein [Sporosarcina aquimarina]
MNKSTTETSIDTKVLDDILKAIDSEYTAIACYELLASQAPNEEKKKRILEIRNDEMRHYETFWYLYYSLTDKEPNPKVTKQCANNYKTGVIDAFIDEQETVDFYHKISRSTDNPIIKNAFIQASADEQNHAVWYLYFLNQL